MASHRSLPVLVLLAFVELAGNGLLSASEPGQASESFTRGSDSLEKGDFATAIAAFTEAIVLNRGYAEAYFGRGVAYGVRGEYLKAIADFIMAIQLRSEDAKAYYGRSESFTGMNSPDETKETRQQGMAGFAAGSGGNAGAAYDLLPLWAGLDSAFNDHRWTNREWAAHRSQMENMMPAIQTGIMAMRWLAPDAISALGPRMTQGVAAAGIQERFYKQGMLPAQAAAMANQVGNMLFGPTGRGLSGFDLQHVGNWMALSGKYGIGPSEMSAKGVVDMARRMAPGMAAIRETMGNLKTDQDRMAALERVTLGGFSSGKSGAELAQHIRMLNYMDKTSGSGRGVEGYAKLGAGAGAYAQTHGGNMGMGNEAAMHAASMDVAYSNMGYSINDLRMGGVSKEQLLQQDAMMTVTARMSQATNELAAIARMGDTGLIKEGSQMAAVYSAITAGNSTYTWQGKQYNALNASAVLLAKGAGIKSLDAATFLVQRKENQTFAGAHNLGTLTRERQWEGDYAVPFKNSIGTALLQAKLGGGTKAIAVILDTMRNFRSTWNANDLRAHGYDPEKNNGLQFERNYVVAEALRAHGIGGNNAEKMASVAGAAAETTATQHLRFASFHNIAMLNSNDMLQAAKDARVGAKGRANAAAAATVFTKGPLHAVTDALRAAAFGDNSAKALILKTFGEYKDKFNEWRRATTEPQN